MGAKRLAIIDDDEAVRQSLVWLLEGQGYQAVGYDGGEAFLAAGDGEEYNGIVLDLRLSGISGIVLLEKLSAWGYCPPVIMLTAHGDVPHAVAALKLGALDFIEKPFDDVHLLERAAAAVALDEQNRERHGYQRKVSAALAQLTDREREVMQLVLAGKLNKQIAEELNISMKTVEVHRSRVFEKMGVKSAVELAGMLAAPGAQGGKA
ncbi:response regulator transcription factor [Chromobacterium sp. IIBBL 290-4]|uniref:response regulator transcription factor n=1 Tax=Chromobacterium sp. IIBBL 290-4 TaxID=2953890 RepID=UPI0020B669DF|nr:response regulator [Chromobacterium sp. IIBBL 290-4]UTH73376.1 response regulator [Chromobacterium sp. IIBBL 290-4]